MQDKERGSQSVPRSAHTAPQCGPGNGFAGVTFQGMGSHRGSPRLEWPITSAFIRHYNRDMDRKGGTKAIPGLLLQYRNDLHWGRFDQAMEHMETMAALSLSVVLRECKQMGTALTVEQGVRFLESHILPHQNRSILKNRADEIAMQFQSVLAKNNRQGIRTQAEKKEVASAWLELAISCAKVPVKYEADEIKRRQKEEKTQRETEPVMA